MIRQLQLAVSILSVITLAEQRRSVPPEPAHKGTFRNSGPMDEIAQKVSKWNPKEPENAWEMSGQFEGDIMIDEDVRNALDDETSRWPDGVIPFYIQKEDFSKEDMDIIKGAIKEYHQKTCLRFRPYKKGDEDHVIVRGNRSGCWSYVGKRGGGQVLNLQTPGCVHHGIVIHEMLHMLGFYHQQSAPERDDFLLSCKVWRHLSTSLFEKPTQFCEQTHTWMTTPFFFWGSFENEMSLDIPLQGKDHNFQKRNTSRVTNYGVKYDYGSIMHYSSHAFSKNGEATITPLDDEAYIGQRDGLSDKDVKKLVYMYNCMEDDSDEMLLWG
ncbi:unnamed protein product [Timema podura]|uniref:Metalloendopeptidase n=1 Tax=Timema podura TaxID=61482 RepID=A0ABN7NUW3_TIMPD|nr:unnamed protein product [Timema podura]